tara:strand:- start:250 stop:585 length:336 start_codon:yes stop_codon:yes gene_type:complete
MAEIDFYNPTDAGTTVLGVTQINKLMPFKSVQGVYITNPFVKVYNCDKLVKEYTLADGLVLSGTNEVGTEKTLTLTLNGTDFVGYEGRFLDAKCSFFVNGDIEIIFKISVK